MQLVERVLIPDDIIKLCENANIFFSQKYANYINQSGQKILYAYNSKLILPVVIYKKIKIKYGIYVSEFFDLSSNITEEEKKAFIDQLHCLLKKDEKLAWVVSAATALFEVYPSDSVRIPFGSHLIDLQDDIDILWSKVHSKHRNSIRRSEKSGIIVKYGDVELLEDYLMLDEQTWARSNKSSYGRDFFVKQFKSLGNNIILAVAYSEGIPQAGACYLFNECMCYYMYGVSADSPIPGAANYLHWDVIQRLKKMGIKKYSFVGCRVGEDEKSKYHGIQRFKERFGGELKIGYMFKTVFNKHQYRMFRELYKLKNGKELSDAVDEEAGKWKDLNI